MPVHYYDEVCESKRKRPCGPRSRSRSTQPCIADNLICPITLELPWDPVTAEDGRIYERSAIEAHFKSREGMSLRSPCTNESMGKKLLPAIHIKSHIDDLIESGLIEDGLTEKWKAKKEEEKQVETWLKNADNGDHNAMYCLADSFCFGKTGIEKDLTKAFQWYEKAHILGNLTATAKLGEFHVKGLGGAKKCKATGLMLLSMAAQEGSRFGAYLLGMQACDDSCLQSERVVASYWLKKCISDEGWVGNLNENSRKRALKKLEEIEQSVS